MFRNDPAMVAGAFASLLAGDASWSRHFERIVFAVYDRSLSQTTYQAFRHALTFERA